jgi:hypothetical protein
LLQTALRCLGLRRIPKRCVVVQSGVARCVCGAARRETYFYLYWVAQFSPQAAHENIVLNASIPAWPLLDQGPPHFDFELDPNPIVRRVLTQRAFAKLEILTAQPP